MVKPTQQLLQQLLYSPRIPTLPILSATTAKAASSTSNEEVKQFPIHRIYCVGQNYREHAIEMGHNPEREPPFFFMKPPDAASSTSTNANANANANATKIPYPPMTSNLHYEGELILAIGKPGQNIPMDQVSDHIFGYALGCDLTRRDLQAKAKKTSRPWCLSKGFDFSAPCGAVLPKEECPFDLVSLSQTVAPASSSAPSSSEESSSPSDCFLTLKINGEIRQNSTLDKMIWNIPELVSHLSQFVCLQPGDLIFTGTPAGVGPLNVGDSVEISCANIPVCSFQIDPPVTAHS